MRSEVAPSDDLPVRPSGRQVEITFGDQRATVVEVGGGMREYRWGSAPVLDGYAVDEQCSAARGQPLLPWPNRLHRGSYEWDGVRHQAPVNEVGKDNALHGYTLGRNWVVAHASAGTAVATLRLHPQEGYPFALDLTVTYTLGPDGLEVRTTARNVGDRPAPFAHGAHPYLTVGTGLIDGAELTVPAATYLPSDENQIPTGRAPVAGTPYDFRTARTIGSTVMDHAFTDLRRDDDGLARVVLSAPDGGRSAAVWIDGSFPFLMVFTGDPLEAAARRGLGVEPMTCPPNGFATGEGVIRLEPGETTTTRWGITVEEPR